MATTVLINYSFDQYNSFQPFSVHGWTSVFLHDVHRLCGAIEGRLRHFLPHWPRMGWQCDQPGKNPWIYSALAWNWTQTIEGTDSEKHSFSHWAIRTRAMERTGSKIYIHSPTELSGLGLWRGQAVIFSFIPLPLSYHDWPQYKQEIISTRNIKASQRSSVSRQSQLSVTTVVMAINYDIINEMNIWIILSSVNVSRVINITMQHHSWYILPHRCQVGLTWVSQR